MALYNHLRGKGLAVIGLPVRYRTHMLTMIAFFGDLLLLLFRDNLAMIHFAYEVVATLQSCRISVGSH